MCLRKWRRAQLGWVTGFSMALATTSMALPAYAQSAETHDAREQERSALYRDGVALAEAGQWSEALTKFQAVVAIRSAPAALIALGTAQEKFGKLASARRTFERAENEAKVQHDPSLAQKASAKSAALESRVARLSVHLSDKSAAVTLDGERTTLPDDGRVEVDAGEHTVAATSADARPFEQRVTVADGETKEMAVEFAPATSSAAPIATTEQAAQTKPPSSGPPTGALILGGVGLGAVVIGAVVYGVARPTYNAGESVRNCPDPSCVEKRKQANDAIGPILAGSIVAFTGVGAVAGAGLWWLLSPNSPKTDKGRGPGGVDLAVVPVRGGYWVGVDRAF
jgi:hypothetical protein